MNYKYLIPISILACVVIYAYASESPTKLQVCQTAFMEASNQIYRYNEIHSRYKVALPDYDCNEAKVSTSGSVIPEPPSVKISPDSETMDEFITRIDLNLTELHRKVCNHQINSPLCNDRKLFDRLYHITEERLPGKNWFPILLGITNAESSLGLNYAKDKIGGTCSGRNNLGGIKWKKSDSGESIRDQKIPDQYGCYLYKFDSLEDYWTSKVNTIRFGYKGCVDSKTPVDCMAYAYVGNPKVAEKSWIRNVSIFLN